MPRCRKLVRIVLEYDDGTLEYVDENMAQQLLTWVRAAAGSCCPEWPRLKWNVGRKLDLRGVHLKFLLYKMTTEVER